jgi:MFS transporter, DHA1 family, inner membrane transport protein
LPLARYRLITALAAIATAVLDAATTGAVGDGELAAIRALAGLAEGVLVWVATGIIVRSRMPDRLAAVFVVVQTLSQSAAAAALAWWIVPRGGWQGGFQALALITLLPAALALWLPKRLAPLRAAAAGRFIWSASAILPLVIAFIQMAAIGSLWAYLEPLGLSKGFDAQGAQTLISETLFMQVIGGIAAVMFVRRLAVVPTLAAGAAVLASAAGAIYLLPAGDTSTFALLCAAFGFTWLFLMPFHVALAFRADPGGNVALLVPAAQLLGSAFGPLMASLMIAGDDASPVPLVSAAFAIAAAIFLSGVRSGRIASSI